MRGMPPGVLGSGWSGVKEAVFTERNDHISWEREALGKGRSGLAGMAQWKGQEISFFSLCLFSFFF